MFFSFLFFYFVVELIHARRMLYSNGTLYTGSDCSSQNPCGLQEAFERSNATIVTIVLLLGDYHDFGNVSVRNFSDLVVRGSGVSETVLSGNGYFKFDEGLMNNSTVRNNSTATSITFEYLTFFNTTNQLFEIPQANPNDFPDLIFGSFSLSNVKFKNIISRNGSEPILGTLCTYNFSLTNSYIVNVDAKLLTLIFLENAQLENIRFCDSVGRISNQTIKQNSLFSGCINKVAPSGQSGGVWNMEQTSSLFSIIDIISFRDDFGVTESYINVCPEDFRFLFLEDATAILRNVSFENCEGTFNILRVSNVEIYDLVYKNVQNKLSTTVKPLYFASNNGFLPVFSSLVYFSEKTLVSGFTMIDSDITFLFLTDVSVLVFTSNEYPTIDVYDSQIISSPRGLFFFDNSRYDELDDFVDMHGHILTVKNFEMTDISNALYGIWTTNSRYIKIDNSNFKNLRFVNCEECQDIYFYSKYIEELVRLNVYSTYEESRLLEFSDLPTSPIRISGSIADPGNSHSTDKIILELENSCFSNITSEVTIVHPEARSSGVMLFKSVGKVNVRNSNFTGLSCTTGSGAFTHYYGNIDDLKNTDYIPLQSDISIENCIFKDNIAAIGSDIYGYFVDDVEIKYSQFSSSRFVSDLSGTFINLKDETYEEYGETGSVHIIEGSVARFTNNTMNGVYNESCIKIEKFEMIWVIKSIFQNCHSDYYGGAISALKTKVNCQHSKFYDNSAVLGGGAVSLNGDSSSYDDTFAPYFQFVEFFRNQCPGGKGGAVHLTNLWGGIGKRFLSRDNHAAFGGNVYSENSFAAFFGYFFNNTAEYAGGTVYWKGTKSENLYYSQFHGEFYGPLITCSGLGNGSSTTKEGIGSNYICVLDYENIQTPYYEAAIGEFTISDSKTIHPFGYGSDYASEPIKAVTNWRYAYSKTLQCPESLISSCPISVYPGRVFEVVVNLLDGHNQKCSFFPEDINIELSAVRVDGEVSKVDQVELKSNGLKFNLKGSKMEDGNKFIFSGLFTRLKSMDINSVTLNVGVESFPGVATINSEISLTLKKCLKGYYIIERDGFSECDACPNGYYSVVENAEQCYECPENADCTDSSQVIADHSYWAYTKQGTNQVEILFCANGKCLEGNECKDNYDPDEPVCSSCKEGYSDWNGTCVYCDSFGFVNLFVVFVFLCFLAYQLLTTHKNSQNSGGSIERIFAFFAQTYKHSLRSVEWSSVTILFLPILNLFSSYEVMVSTRTDINDENTTFLDYLLFPFTYVAENVFACPYPRSSYVIIYTKFLTPIIFIVIVMILMLMCLCCYYIRCTPICSIKLIYSLLQYSKNKKKSKDDIILPEEENKKLTDESNESLVSEDKKNVVVSGEGLEGVDSSAIVMEKVMEEEEETNDLQPLQVDTKKENLVDDLEDSPVVQKVLFEKKIEKEEEQEVEVNEEDDVDDVKKDEVEFLGILDRSLESDDNSELEEGGESLIVNDMNDSEEEKKDDSQDKSNEQKKEEDEKEEVEDEKKEEEEEDVNKEEVNEDNKEEDGEEKKEENEETEKEKARKKKEQDEKDEVDKKIDPWGFWVKTFKDDLEKRNNAECVPYFYCLKTIGCACNCCLCCIKPKKKKDENDEKLTLKEKIKKFFGIGDKPFLQECFTVILLVFIGAPSYCVFRNIYKVYKSFADLFLSASAYSATLVSLCIITYQLLLENALSSVNCFKYHTADGEYEYRNWTYSDIKCWEGWFWVNFVFFTLIPIIYCILIPIIIFIFLFVNKRRLYKISKKGKKSFSDTYGILYFCYRPRFWWFETFAFARKMFIVTMITFSSSSEAALYTDFLLAGFLFVCLVLHLITRPYKKPLDNFLEGISLFSLGILQLIRAASFYRVNVTLSLIIVLLTFTPVFLILTYLKFRSSLLFIVSFLEVLFVKSLVTCFICFYPCCWVYWCCCCLSDEELFSGGKKRDDLIPLLDHFSSSDGGSMSEEIKEDDEMDDEDSKKDMVDLEREIEMEDISEVIQKVEDEKEIIDEQIQEVIVDSKE